MWVPLFHAYFAICYALEIWQHQSEVNFSRKKKEFCIEFEMSTQFKAHLIGSFRKMNRKVWELLSIWKLWLLISKANFAISFSKNIQSFFLICFTFFPNYSFFWSDLNFSISALVVNCLSKQTIESGLAFSAKSFSSNIADSDNLQHYCLEGSGTGILLRLF